jgi:hypothetical protein
MRLRPRRRDVVVWRQSAGRAGLRGILAGQAMSADDHRFPAIGRD